MSQTLAELQFNFPIKLIPNNVRSFLRETHLHQYVLGRPCLLSFDGIIPVSSLWQNHSRRHVYKSTNLHLLPGVKRGLTLSTNARKVWCAVWVKIEMEKEVWLDCSFKQSLFTPKHLTLYQSINQFYSGNVYQTIAHILWWIFKIF